MDPDPDSDPFLQHWLLYYLFCSLFSLTCSLYRHSCSLRNQLIMFSIQPPLLDFLPHLIHVQSLLVTIKASSGCSVSYFRSLTSPACLLALFCWLYSVQSLLFVASPAHLQPILLGVLALQLTCSLIVFFLPTVQPLPLAVKPPALTPIFCVRTLQQLLLTAWQGCGSGSAWIPINLCCWIRIQEAKMTYKYKKSE